MLLYWFFGIIVVSLTFVALLLYGILVCWKLPRTHLRRQGLWSKLFLTWAVVFLGASVVLWSAYKFNNHTEYSSAYTERNFQKVVVGMSEQQVLDLLGQPLGKYELTKNNHCTGFNYSMSDSGGEGDYEIRQIEFSKGRVVKVRHETYYD